MIKKAIGAPKKVENVDDGVTVILHNDKVNTNINNICIGLSNHAVDTKRGVFKKNDEADVKRQKNAHGEEITGINKGKITKYSTKFLAILEIV